MILKDRKVIFIHIPRCAGTSIKESLKTISKNYEGKPWHLKLSEHEKKYKVNLNNYFIFTIIRNPYDRILSVYNYKKYVRDWWDVKDRGFDEWIRFLNKQSKGDFLEKINCVEWLDVNIPIMIYRYENIDKRYLSLMNLLKLPKLKHLHKLKKNYNIKDETKEIIYNMFEKDFKRFNYEK